MRIVRIVVWSVVLMLIGAVVGAMPGPVLGQTGQPAQPPKPGTPGTLPPGHPPMAQPPAGQPPMGAPGAGPSVVPPSAESGKGSQGLTWTVPAAWTKEKPTSQMRRAQYKLPGSAGPGECVVFYFGPGQGGDVQSNVVRWVAQFKGPDGKPLTSGQPKEIKVGDIKVTTVEVKGTYVGGMGGATTGGERPDSMLLGAIAEGPDSNWFFRAIGPRATIEAQRAAFDKMVRSIKKGKAS